MVLSVILGPAPIYSVGRERAFHLEVGELPEGALERLCEALRGLQIDENTAARVVAADTVPATVGPAQAALAVAEAYTKGGA